MSALYAGLMGFQAVGGYYAAKNVKETAILNRDISSMNAEFAELDAYDAEIEGYSAKALYQESVDATLGTQKAELAAANVDINYGSAKSITEETELTAQLNGMEIIKQAEEKALGYERESRDIRTAGALDYAGARSRITASRIGTLTSMASTGITGYRRSR